MSQSWQERFWKRVDRSGGPDSCWLWTGAISSSGYGVLWVDGKTESTHRLALRTANVDIPPRVDVCHECEKLYPPGDVTHKRCCNPAHLFVGTKLQNATQRVANQRQASGSVNGQAKLTESAVLQIREMYGTGEWTQRALGVFFGVGHVAVHDIVKRKRWRHI